MAYVSTTILSGQLALTTAAVQVSTLKLPAQEVLIQSDPGNITNVLVGDATTQTLVLTPGQSLTLPVNTLSIIYVKMAGNTGVINWLQRN